MTKNETQELSEEEWAVVYSAVEKAVDALVDFRKQEGAALEKSSVRRSPISLICWRLSLPMRKSVWPK